MNETIDNKIRALYRKNKGKPSYLAVSGIDLLITILTIIAFMSLISYNLVHSKFKEIKQNWTENRCKPHIIPFAGLINKNDPTKSSFENTGENFEKCTQDILNTISDDATKPINYMLDTINKLFKEMVGDMKNSKALLANIRHNISKITGSIMGKALNLTTPIVKIGVTIKDTSAKIIGILTTFLYSFISVIKLIVATLKDIYKIIVAAQIALSATLVLLWVGFYAATFIPGLSTILLPPIISLTILISTIIALGVVVEVIINLLEDPNSFKNREKKDKKHNTDKKHNKDKKHNTDKTYNNDIKPYNSKDTENNKIFTPCCFDKNTRIRMWDKSNHKTIQQINVGDKLADGSFVTAKMKLSSCNQNMFKLNGVIVSGLHKIKNEDEWMYVADYKNSEYIEDYREPFIYCINTTNKKILVENMEFMDWDEIDDMDINEIRQKLHSNKFMNTIRTGFTYKDIHYYLDGGFSHDTKIELEDGRSVNICDIDVNDILRFGEEVIGIVEIDSTNISNCFKYKLPNGDIISGGPNLNFYNENINDVTNINEVQNDNELNCNKIYHLLTDQKQFTIQNTLFYDYDSALERYLERDGGFYSIHAKNFYL